MEVLNAKWELDNGRTVELRIAGDAYDRLHPFKQYQQKRNGRMGTRFVASIGRCDTGEFLWIGEAMLASWSDSSTTGQSIKLWLDEETERHPFAGCDRRRAQQPGTLVAVVLQEIDDDQTPLHEPVQKKRGTFSQSAHLMVTSPMFVQWLTETQKGRSWDPELARMWAKQVAGVESLSDLDRNPAALEAFRTKVQYPYNRWSGQDPDPR